MKLPISSAIIGEAEQHLRSAQDLLQFLKDSGVSQMRSCLALSHLMGMASDEAKELVLTSPVWGPQSAETMRLHDVLWEGAEKNLRIRERAAARPGRPKPGR